VTGPRRLVRLDGAAAGQAVQLTRDFTTLGRHPSCDIGVDPATESPVSARHAALFRDGNGWILRDLESTNGTWVDGQRIRGDHRLAEGALIRLGERGPGLRFEAAGEGEARSAGPSDHPRAGLPRAEEIPPPVALAPDLRPAVRGAPPRASRPRPAIRVAGLLLLGLAAWGGWNLWERRRDDAKRQAALLARVDSLAAALAAAEQRETRLAEILAAARTEAAAAGDSIRAAGSTRSRLATLEALVGRLAARQVPLLRAADFDLAAVMAANADAVTLVLAERPGTGTVSGTGFVAEARGDTSWIVTSRHLLVDSTGGEARRLGVIFNGSGQNFQATVVRTHPTLDLGLLRVVVRGGTPAVRGVDGAVEPGAPVAAITFPLGLDLAAGSDWRQAGVTASAVIGTVTQARPDQLQVDGYGVEGMSGSPLFNGEGLVVGVVFGGVPESRGRIVLAVPAGGVRDLLAGGGS